MNHFAASLRERVRACKDIKELHSAVAACALEELLPLAEAEDDRKAACYFSAEFLMGRMIYNNLYNLGVLEDFRAIFTENGLDPNMFEAIDDAALGNGGLGRLAACFLDSGATLGYRLHGFGIRYRYGLFRQYFKDGFQMETADDWLRFGDPWSVRREDERVRVDCKGQSVWAVPYDMPVVGFGGKTANNLRLWQAEPIEPFDFARFNDQDYEGAFRAAREAESISSVLYPNDDTDIGKKLRLKQQYFFASASLQSIIAGYKKRGGDFADFARHYAIQLNDTHPTIAIPELLRLLMDGENMDFPQAFDIVRATFAYTNHTIMAEALEKWDISLFLDVVPEVYPYIVLLQNRLKRDLAARGIGDKTPYHLIDGQRIHMARMALYATHSTNGVAALHTEILKADALKEWYALYPERFNNKTNGITQRRWLGLCNPELSRFITDRIGDGWITNLDELEKLAPYAEDPAALSEFRAIKRIRKQRLADYIRIHENGAVIDPNSLFDIQIKRLHEYKRQFLNALSILDIYFSIKEGKLENFAPMTFLFGAKAAPGYRRAKAIIKFINEIAKKIDADESVRDKLKVLFVQNYNVSYAEMLIPAADISEQISTAGTEASGTGNMKLMLNGAVTLGTYDGANVEIVEQAGEENNYIFGARVEDIRAIAGTYDPAALYKANPRIRRALDTLIDGTFSDGRTGIFEDLFQSIAGLATDERGDQYYLLRDFEAYVDAKIRANRDGQDAEAFSKKCFLNMAHAGKFSSDRTVAQYAKEIWGL